MSAADPRIALVEQAFRDFNERDVDGVVDFIHPEVRAHVAPGLMNQGDYQGFEGFAAMTSAWGEAWEAVYDVTCVDLLDDTHLLATVNQKVVGAGSGVPIEQDVFYLIGVSNLKAVRFEIHPTRESALSRL